MRRAALAKHSVIMPGLPKASPGPKSTPPGGQPALLVREPVGVVAAIIPWNAPHSLMGYKVAAALIAGCTVIIKASPEAPASPYYFAEICEEAGLPAGVVNVVTADRAVSELLVRNPGVDKVSFTGSTLAGRKIASICGERIARVTLELGGKSPAIILDDYDVAKAATAVARAAHGPRCDRGQWDIPAESGFPQRLPIQPLSTRDQCAQLWSRLRSWVLR